MKTFYSRTRQNELQTNKPDSIGNQFRINRTKTWLAVLFEDPSGQTAKNTVRSRPLQNRKKKLGNNASKQVSIEDPPGETVNNNVFIRGPFLKLDKARKRTRFIRGSAKPKCKRTRFIRGPLRTNRKQNCSIRGPLRTNREKHLCRWRPLQNNTCKLQTTQTKRVSRKNLQTATLHVSFADRSPKNNLNPNTFYSRTLQNKLQTSRVHAFEDPSGQTAKKLDSFEASSGQTSGKRTQKQLPSRTLSEEVCKQACIIRGLFQNNL